MRLTIKAKYLLGLTLVMGCAGIKTTIQFNRQDTSYAPNTKLAGTVTGNFKEVQAFRSLLESLEYRISEKAK